MPGTCAVELWKKRMRTFLPDEPSRDVSISRRPYTFSSYHFKGMICTKQKPSTVEVRVEVLYGLYDSQKFLPGHTIISFLFGQTLTEIGDDTLLSIYFLGQHSSDAFMACIPPPVRISSPAPFFLVLASSHLFFSSSPALFFLVLASSHPVISSSPAPFFLVLASTHPVFSSSPLVQLP
ncbi:hypothetical protein HNY73_018806 [Argiope bruennichi]|uniref:Uncharacterized protein n=1 Tax=Argiope bruennichi TaxID=94029 RepID=A0A8T0EFH2_ARGBR|nr:hypothetical protein HNY73_018806 [Argiope bruennichi]